MSYNTDNCNKWHNNPLINPISKRPIKKDGPIYKTFQKECASILKLSAKKNTNPIYNTDNCKKWRNNPLINPISKRAIKKDGPIYKTFQKECDNIKLSPKKKVIIKSSNNDTELCKKWIANKLINPKTNKPIKLNGPLYKQYLLKCSKFLQSSKSPSSSFKKPSSSSSSKEVFSASSSFKKPSSSSSSFKKPSSSSSSFKKPSSSSSSFKKPSSSSSFKKPSSSSKSSSIEVFSASSSFKKPSSSSSSKSSSSKKYMSLNSSSSRYVSATMSQSKSNLKTASTSFSKSSTVKSAKTANDYLSINSSELNFIENRITKYNILNKYINKIKDKYSNNCLKKYKILNGVQLLRIGNKIILEKKLGNSGAYGVVYKSYYRRTINDDYNYNINFAVKICEKTDINKQEIKIANILTNKVVTENYLHFPILYGYLKCNYDELYDLYSSEKSSASLNYSPESLFDNRYNSILNRNELYFQIYEIADGTLNKYLAYMVNDITDKIENELVFNALAQIFISLIWFYSITDMCHADTHFDNFLYHKIKPGGYFEYTIYNYPLKIKNIGYLWILNDFGLAENLINSKRISQVIRDFKMILAELERKKSYFIDNKIPNFITEAKNYLDENIYEEEEINNLLIHLLNCLLKYSETFKLVT
jgi:hypothetical protein